MQIEERDEDLPIMSEPHVFNINYMDFNQVRVLAKRMGRGYSVVKYRDRPNYNIVHTENEFRLPPKTKICFRS